MSMGKLRWYVVHVHSSFEQKVASSIRERAQMQGLSELIPEILVPSEEVVEIRRGQRYKSKRKFFPGYVLVKMELNNETQHLVKNQPKVTSFLGNKDRENKDLPTPISEKEVERLMAQMREGSNFERLKTMFEIGEQVRVSDGPFASFNGHVEEVDTEKSRLKVLVSIFGRSTPVDVDFSQVEKLQ